MLNKIRLFHRQLNFQSTPVERKKCEASLRHSLRIEPEQNSVKTLEWNPQLNQNNLIWCNDKTLNLADFSTEDRWLTLFDIAPEPKLKNHGKLQMQRRQYRQKIKKTIESERNASNTVAAQFLEEVLSQTERVSYTVIKHFSNLNMSRTNQRIKMLEIYLNAHNQLSNRPPTENSTYIQEGIFKIPHKWGIGSKIISLKEYINFTHNFLANYFSEYPIKAIIGHDDERNENEDTGLHTHYYLSGKNKNTGRYDLRIRQVEIVNEHLVKHNLSNELLPQDGKLTHQQSKVLGHYYQRVVQGYINKNLLNPKGLTTEFADETEKASEQYKHMIVQAKLPKSNREFNFYNRELTKFKNQLELLKNETNDLNKQKENILPMLATAIEELDNTERFLNQQQMELDNLQRQKELAQGELDTLGMRYLALEHSVDSKNDELSYVESELEKTENSLRQVNHESKALLENIIESVFMLLLAKTKNNTALVEKFTMQLTNNINKKLPVSLQPMLSGAIELTKDSGLTQDV